MWQEAEHALTGVGDAALGEWRENGERAIHLRRRLTDAEWGDQPWGMDYRRTWEGEKRLRRALKYMPELVRDQLMRELTS